MGPYLVACGPSADEPEVVTQRELLVLEEATDDEYYDPTTPAFDLFLVGPDRTRQQVPVSTSGTHASVAWGLDGDAVLVKDWYLHVWAWSELDQEPTPLRSSNSFEERVSLSIAPDSRYAVISASTSIDVTSSSSGFYDLVSGELLYSTSRCGNAESFFFSWHGDGPDAVMLSNSCVGLGEVTGYSLSHATPRVRTQLFEFTPEEVPKLSMSRQGGLLYLDFENRWQLYDVVARRVVTEQPAGRYANEAQWSPDGRSLYRVENAALQRIDASGAVRWVSDLGIQPVKVSVSPTGDRLVVMSGDCGGASCIAFYDTADGSGRYYDRPGGAQVWWAPQGNAIIVSARYDWSAPPGEEGFDWKDAETGQAHFLAQGCSPPSWSPDGETVVCMDPCPDQGEGIDRPLLFDAEGIALAEGACDRYASTPQWSPDSDVLAIELTTDAELPADAQHRVVLLDLEGRRHELVSGSLPPGAWRPGPIR